MEKRNKVLLVYASGRVNTPRLPMSILALASYIRKRGYNPTLLDLRIDDYEDYDLKRFMCIGISVMTGSGITKGREFARYVREKTQHTPLVWGGVHPSMFVEQTLADDLVDFIVRNDGEKSFLELLNAIVRNKEYNEIEGISYKNDNKMFHNPDRDFVDMNKLNLPAYDLVGIVRYSDSTQDFSYESSRGCPSRCGFCYNPKFHKRIWRAKNAKRVIADLEEINERYSPKRITFVDDNFFVDKERVMEIAKYMIEKEFEFEWSACVRADDLAKYSNEEVELLKQSKCWCLVIGAESGSERVLRLFKKDITKEQIIISVKKLVENNIVPQLTFVIGHPEESEFDLMDTLDFYDELIGLGDIVEVNGLFIFLPIPATDMFNLAKKYGYKGKDSFSEWGDWRYTNPVESRWLNPKAEAISTIVRFKYVLHRLKFYSSGFKGEKLRGLKTKILFYTFIGVFRISAYLRWNFRLFSYAPEWKLFNNYCLKKYPDNW